MIAQRNEQSQLQIDYSLSTFSIHLCVFFLSRKEFHSFAVGELQIRLSNAAAEKLQGLSKEANVSSEEFLMNLLQKASEEAIKG